MEAAKKVFSGPATKREGGKKLDKKVVGPLKKNFFGFPTYGRTTSRRTKIILESAALYTQNIYPCKQLGWHI